MGKTNKTWIVIASSADARIYHIEKDPDQHNGHKFECDLLHELTHAKSCLKSQDLMSDKPGRYKNGSGPTSAMEHNDAHHTEQEHFAIELSHFLKKELDKNQYHEMILCAEPRFYGLLKKSLSKEVLQHLKHTIQKDYVPLKTSELRRILEKIYLNEVD